MTKMLRSAACTAMWLVAGCAPVGAQEVASSLEQLRVLVRPGDTVTVTDSGGQRTRGKVSSLSDSSLALLVDGTERSLQQSDIRTIRQRREDPLSNGARNGFIVGGGLGLLAGIAFAATGESGAGVFVPLAAGLYGGMGAAIGVGFDAMIRSDTVIYDSAWKRPAAKLTIAPLIVPGRRGVSVTLTK